MPSNSTLLQTFLTVMKEDQPVSYFLNKQFDIYEFAKNLYREVEEKRSSVTAITREQANQLKNNNLQFSTTKHESRINCLYRMIGLPTELSLDNNFALSDDNGKNITNKDDLTKKLVQREFSQLLQTTKEFSQGNNDQALNAQLNSTQDQAIKVIAQLFDPHYLQKHTNRLFPIVQFSQVQNVVELTNRIAPAFASTSERYVNKTLMQPPFLETVISIRLLPQSGGDQLNTQGVVERIILKSLAFGLKELARRYHDNQTEAEKHLIDGIAFIRNKVTGVNSSLVKQADLNANTREPNSPQTQGDTVSKNQQTQNEIYEAAVSLLPTENDIIPTGIQIDDVPFQTRSIKNNALTQSFATILKVNTDALQRAIDESGKVIKKRQLTQDRLTAEINSIIGELNGVSLAEILIVISALFVMDEQDLMGLISKSRFDQIIAATNNNSSTFASSIAATSAASALGAGPAGVAAASTTSISTDSAQKQLNIFDILKQFRNSRTNTTAAVKILQDTVKTIYDAYVAQLAKAHQL